MASRPLFAWMLVSLVWFWGCAPRGAISLDSSDPQARVQALTRVWSSPAESDIPALIEALGSADPAQRMMAIHTLERITGETLGYRHYDEAWRRREAIERWRAWWTQRRAEGEDPAASEAP